MTELAEKIWEAFCKELTQEPTDDMREALATSVRELVIQLQYYPFDDADDGPANTVLDARDILDIVDELDKL